MGKGTYGSQPGRPKKVNMQTLPPEVKKRLMALKKKRKNNPFGKGRGRTSTKPMGPMGP